MLSIDSQTIFGFNDYEKMAQTLLLIGQNKKELRTQAEYKASEQSSSFDTLIFDAVENKGIDSAKELIQSSFRKPFNSEFSTLIVLEADKLTTEAQNSLLKLIEEPPEETQIILTTSNRNSLLPTVVSRCLEIALTSEAKNDLNLSIFGNFFEKSFGERLEILEKTGPEPYLEFLREGLHRVIKAPESELDTNIKGLAEKLRIASKLNRAAKSSANKKLIALLLAQI